MPPRTLHGLAQTEPNSPGCSSVFKGVVPPKEVVSTSKLSLTSVVTEDAQPLMEQALFPDIAEVLFRLFWHLI